MNIQTPFPTSVLFNPSNVNLDAARRENALRETIPQTDQSEQGAEQQGLGSESDRARSPGQQPALTYERILQNTGQGAEQGTTPDNGRDESAGRQDAESRQQEQAEQREVEELERRDQEVRAHEQAHAAVGGQYASAPSYEFQTGPDGRQYAVGGEVSIDISEESTPEQTVRKMQQVRAAALAPAEPSPQDLQVAAEAQRKTFEARAEAAEQERPTLDGATASESRVSESADESAGIVASGDVTPPVRTLERGQSEQGEVNILDRRALEIDERTQTAIGVINQFYQGVSEPQAQRFQATA